jgi:hypothetical protein
MGKVYWTYNVLYFYLQLLFETFFILTNIYWFTHKICPKTLVGLHVKYLLFLPSFNQNWNVPTKCSQTPQYKFHENSFSSSCVVSYIQIERQSCSKLNRCFTGLQTWSQKYESYNITYVIFKCAILSSHVMSILRNFFTTSQNPPVLPTVTYWSA